MDKTRYDLLCANLPSKLIIRLDRIKRYLSQNMVSVMVGAGFSKNAKKMIPNVEMKDWNSLVKTFWKQLYPGQAERFNFVTPMHLASQLEALNGRAELDQQIMNSLPDDNLQPGDLHVAMMGLPWRDIFTTNYDRLLERAGEQTDRKYTLVTNKETLIYSSPPRVVKLHGSFPDCRPFIMTEDDFRTYPDVYPEFVNTVRQALIENVFCLIGFSGEDPNFLSWLGWLRDVMGSLISPVYLIDYRKNLGDADVKLNYQRKVDIVNLAEIPEIKDYGEALDFFFEYLRKDLKPEEWNPEIHRDQYIRGFTAAYIDSAKAIRESYPGWIFLPERYYESFSDITSSFPYGEESFKKLDESKRIELLYELDWRLRISCSPNIVAWFYTALEELDLDSATDESKNMILQLKLTLLSIYRRSLEFEKYDELETKLKRYFEKNNSEKICQLYYEGCLNRLFKQQFKEVKTILSGWQVSEVDFLGQFWKASILNSIGEWDTAAAILDSVRKKARSSLLKSNEQKPLFDSCIHVANSFLRYYSQKYDVSNIDIHRSAFIDLDHLFSGLKLKTGLNTNKGGASDHHNFRMNDIHVVWDGGERGFFQDYVFSLRTILLMERLGYPLQVMGRCVVEYILEPVLKAMARYDSGMVISMLLRMNASPYLQKSVMTRELMGYVKKEEAKQFYDMWKETVRKAIAKDKETCYQDELVFKVLIPVMIKLCVKLDDDEVLEMFQIYEKVYSQGHMSYDEDNVNLLFDCVPDSELVKCLELAFHTNIGTLPRVPNRKFVLPERSYGSYVLDRDARQKILDALKSNKIGAILDAIYRLECLNIHCNTAWLDDELRNEVIAWRNRSEKSNLVLTTFETVGYNAEKDEKIPIAIVGEELKRFKKRVEDDSTPSEMRLHMVSSSLDVFVAGGKYVGDCLNDILSIMTSYLEKDAEVLLKHRWEDYLGDYGHASYMIRLLTEFVKKIELDGQDTNILKRLLTAIEKIYENYPTAQIQAILMTATHSTDRQKTSFVSKISPRFYSSRHDVRIDALKALQFLDKKGLNSKKEYSNMIQYVGISLNENICDILRGLTELSGKLSGEQCDQLQKQMKLLLQRITEKSFNKEAETDIIYEGMKLLVKLKDNKKMTKVYGAWKKYVQDPETFKDIKVVLAKEKI